MGIVSRMNDEEKNKFWTLFISVREKAQHLFCSQIFWSHIVDRYGEMPLRNPEDLSLWVTSVLPNTCFTRIEKQRLLCSTDTMERLTLCYERLLLLDRLMALPESNQNETQSQPDNNLSVTAEPFVPGSSNNTPSADS